MAAQQQTEGTGTAGATAASSPSGTALLESTRRLLLVSNRLPVTVQTTGHEASLVRSAGGLATGLSSVHRPGRDVWIGWLGDASRHSAAQLSGIRDELAERCLIDVSLTAAQVRAFYDELSNGVIWPMFHYMPDRTPLHSRGWKTYQEVNERFAEAAAREYRDGDMIWVHDYQLLLVPGMLRRRLPHARIGFFLHIPFPSYEIFRMLPWRAEVLEEMLGADVVGFHTATYVFHFARAVRMVLNYEPGPESVTVGMREVQLRVSPMGIDTAEFERRAASPAVRAHTAALRESSGGRRLILGVDRLDYTKGIPRRLLAFQRLLETSPDLRDTVRLVQLAVPSRSGVEHYKAFRRQINEIVGRINGEFATPESVPIHYMYRSIDRDELVALYCAADVMAVTPLRDGMNLVAKEFVASRIDEDGVLLLSELAGAAEELSEALLVNPFDIDSMADSMRAALLMSPADRRARMRTLRRRVSLRTVHHWAGAFVQELDALPDHQPEAAHATVDAETLSERLRTSPAPVFVLDYDGTLVPIVSVPDAAHPDAELLTLLRELGSAYSVHVVSGRSRGDLGTWFEGVPVTLWAEHGACVRKGPGAPPWESTAAIATGWMARVQPILEKATAATPGTLVEEKGTSLAWHYRTASDPAFIDRQLDALRRELEPVVRTEAIEILRGNKVIEVRPRGVAKSRVVERILEQGADGASVIAIGDDTTDEDMFGALPETAVTIRVGEGPSAARYRLPDPHAVRELLRQYVYTAPPVERAGGR